MNKLNLSDSIKKEVIPFVNCFNHISTRDLEEILEYLQDQGWLSEKGIKFRNAIWELFVKK